MKTQINSLVTGSSTKAGTSKKVRSEFSEKVISENNDGMTIMLKGYKIELKANWSLSGKSVSYTGKLPLELYVQMFGNYCLPKNPEMYIQINGDMTIWATTNSKKSFGSYQKIAESEITIL